MSSRMTAVTQDGRRADVVILTAIKLELDAVQKVEAGAVAGSSWEEAPGPSGLPVVYRRFVGKGDRPLRVAVALAPDMGATAVVNTLLPLVAALRPRCVAMCGVCAGRRGKVALGDVIAADRVYYHDTGKQLSGRVEQDLTTYKLRDDWKVALDRMDPVALFGSEAWFLARPLTTQWREQRVLVNLGNGDANPWAAVDPTMTTGEWQEILAALEERKLVAASGLTLTAAGRRFVDKLRFAQRGNLPDVSPAGPQHPLRLHVAPIGTGARVIEDEQIWMFVSEAMRKTLGIEMEAAAIGELVHRQRQHALDWVVLKGVMDFADDGRDDHFKNYAARVSAECLLWFLREHVTFPRELSAATGNHAPALAAVAQSPGLGTHTFVGRARELAEIEALLTGATDVQLRAALDGLPGIGKTELARQVVARLAQGKKFPGGIFWFDAEHPDLRLQWAKLAEDAGGPALPDLDARAAWGVRQVAQRAQQGEAVLIVLDNVETWDPPPGPLPDLPAIRMLVTTRARWLHNSFRTYEVPPLELGPARTLLQAIMGCEIADADELLAALGGHVVSIEIAATYLREYGTSPVEYLRQLATGKNPGSTVADQTAYRATAESAFRLLWRRITADVRQAWVLAAQLPSTWFSSELAEAIGLDTEHRRGLVRLHLLDRDNQGRHQMHRLLREFALAKKPPSKSVQEAVIRGAAELLEAGDEALTFQRYRRDAVSFAHLVAASPNIPSGARLMIECARALGQLGELPAARSLFEQALASALKTFGEDHPTVATSRNNLALVLQDLGELPEARSLLEQALASDLKTFGEDDFNVAVRRNNLALVLKDLGVLPAARSLFERALVALKTFGEDHPTVAKIRSNLAMVLKDLGELPEARRLFEQALESAVKTFGEDHPTVATSRNNLAWVLQVLGKLATARSLFEQALGANLKTFGEDHPAVAMSRNNLAMVLKDLGELPAVRSLFEQALASNLKTFGEHHPTVAMSRNNLAMVLKDLGELPEARSLFKQALASNLKIFGEHHLRVATARNNLAMVLEDLGELPEARILLEQALASNLKAFGEDHPEVAIARNNLAMVLKDLGKMPEARILLEQALASAIKTFGDDHPKVAARRNNLAMVLKDLGELPAARSLFEQALASDLKTFGEDHPTVAMRRNNLASVHQALGELLAARSR